MAEAAGNGGAVSGTESGGDGSPGQTGQV